MPLTKIKSLGITDGTILGTDVNSTFDLTGKTVTLPAGTGGKVLQVVQDTMSSDITTTSGNSTQVDTGLDANITPSSASNKILIMVTHPQARKTGDNALEIQLCRNTTVIYDNIGNYDTSDAQQITDVIHFSYVDSPNTTSAINYKTRFASTSATIYGATSPSNIILMEIAG